MTKTTLTKGIAGALAALSIIGATTPSVFAADISYEENIRTLVSAGYDEEMARVLSEETAAEVANAFR
ncbi:MAG: hypothetical protein KBS74_07820 [Clostridiales bacterium]|nr:hypothetical protein [Candidatus Cacconaster stercorequi]